MEPQFKIAAFYQFAPLSNLEVLQQALLSGFDELEVKGSLLLADEGVNGTLAGRSAALDEALTLITRVTGLHDFNPKFSLSEEMPFRRIKRATRLRLTAWP